MVSSLKLLQMSVSCGFHEEVTLPLSVLDPFAGKAEPPIILLHTDKITAKPDGGYASGSSCP
jgi:hypothetical protein